MKTNKNLFYRQLQKHTDETYNKCCGKNECYTDCGYTMWTDINENSKISEIIHSIFNYEAGDSYAWPCNNISKEDIDKLWESGQRAFVLQLGYKEVVLYDLKIITDKEYRDFFNKDKEKIDNIKNQVIELIEDEIEDKDIHNYLSGQVDEIFKNYNPYTEI